MNRLSVWRKKFPTRTKVCSQARFFTDYGPCILAATMIMLQTVNINNDWTVYYLYKKVKVTPHSDQSNRALLYLIKGDRVKILHTSTQVSNVSCNKYALPQHKSLSEHRRTQINKRNQTAINKLTKLLWTWKKAGRFELVPRNKRGNGTGQPSIF